MKDTPHKFVFLGVLVASVIFSRGVISQGLVPNMDKASDLDQQRASAMFPSSRHSGLSVDSSASNFENSGSNIFSAMHDLFEKMAAHGQSSGTSQGVLRADVSSQTGGDSSQMSDIQVPSLKSDATYQPKNFYEAQRGNVVQVETQAALVAGLIGKEVYFEKNTEKRWPLASLTKLMTAVIATDRLKLEDAAPPLPMVLCMPWVML